MIPPETIAAVRDRTNIVTVIQESVPSLKKRGRSWVGLCPFHKEKTPSFHVNADRGFFHCFGCKESGSAIDFVMKHDGYTFPEAVRMLAERCGVLIEEDSRPRDEVDRAKKHKEDLYAALGVAAAFYERQLREHPDRAYALRELAARGLLPSWARDEDGEPTEAMTKVDDVLQAFRVGYAPAGWDALANHLRSQSVSPSMAEQVGLLVPKSSGGGHYDRFRHRLMFAVVDPQGRVVAFSGRALEPIAGEKPPDQKPAKYINSPESAVYTKGHMLFGIYQARHAIRHADQAVLVEGNFDVVSLHARGIDNVVAPLGTAFTPEQAALLRRYAGNVVVFFDADLAGRKATRAAREACKSAGLYARVASASGGKDPDELVRSEGGPESVKTAIAHARGMLEFLLDDLLDESFAAADAYERAARVEQVKKLLSEEDDPLVRSMTKTYVDRLAGRLDLVRREEGARGERSPDTFRALEATVKQALATAQARGPTTSPQRARIAPQSPGAAARKEIVGALIDFPELLDDSDVAEAVGLLEGESARIVAALARARVVSGIDETPKKTLDNDAFLAQMPPAIHSFAAQRLAAPRFEAAEEARDVVLRSADSLRKRVVHDEKDVMTRRMNDEEWETQIQKARETTEQVRSTRVTPKKP